jgi:predicted small metal-binding protein
MRVIECTECGDLLAAANEEELAACVVRHRRTEHGQDTSEDDASRLVAAGSYEATDS